MKKLLLTISICLFGSSLSLAQTTILEQYFHELKGLEDSSGITHLFYRMYEKSEFQCSEGNGGKTVDHYGNDVFHFTVATQSDSILFDDGYGEWCLDGMFDSRSTYSYSFYDNDPSKWVANSSYEYTFSIHDYKGYTLDIQPPIAIKQTVYKPTIQVPKEIFLSPNGDSLYARTYSDFTIPLPGRGDDWPIFEAYDQFEHYADSVAFVWEILGIHPQIDSLYFSAMSGDLYRSSHYSSNFTLADSSARFTNLFFDSDTIHVYSLTSSGLLVSDELGKKNSWEVAEIDFTTHSTKFLAVDPSVPGHVFVSDSTDILFSDNHGDTFTSHTTVKNEITSLYKKPDSNLLYVLTRKELLEVNTETKSTLSLKQLSVSVEPKPSEIPEQVSLSQNYPNPFNPSTVISYQLSGNSLVRLEVFDVIGRKVAVLVDGERKSTGAHQVTFEAGNLSSGVYFYRLETAGQTLTQKMLLVK
jgi:hypothetical protein